MPAIEAALPQPPPSAVEDANHDGRRYEYVRLEDVTRRYFQDEGRGEFHHGQLVWVCKSKGRKKGGKPRSLPGTQAQSSSSSLPSTADHPQKDRTDDETAMTFSNAKNHFHLHPNNRLELFLRARVVQTPELRLPEVSNDRANDDGRVLVRYPRGSTYRVRRDHLLPILEHKSRIVIVADETPLYRKCCAVHTLPHETFLEIGSDLGHNVQRVHETRERETDESTVSSSHANRLPRLVGVDKSPYSVKTSRASYPHLTFVLWDPLEDPTRHLHDGLGLKDGDRVEFRPDVVAVDINGSRELPAVLACVSSLWSVHHWEPRLVIVKSRTLHAHLHNNDRDSAVAP